MFADRTVYTDSVYTRLHAPGVGHNRLDKKIAHSEHQYKIQTDIEKKKKSKHCGIVKTSSHVYIHIYMYAFICSDEFYDRKLLL